MHIHTRPCFVVSGDKLIIPVTYASMQGEARAEPFILGITRPASAALVLSLVTSEINDHGNSVNMESEPWRLGEDTVIMNQKQSPHGTWAISIQHSNPRLICIILFSCPLIDVVY